MARQEAQMQGQPELVTQINATRSAVNRMRTAEEAIPHINAIIRYTASSTDQRIKQRKLERRKELMTELYEGVKAGTTTQTGMIESFKGFNKQVASSVATLQTERKALTVKNPDGTEATHEGKPLNVETLSGWVDDAEVEFDKAKAELYKLYPKQGSK